MSVLEAGLEIFLICPAWDGLKVFWVWINDSTPFCFNNGKSWFEEVRLGFGGRLGLGLDLDLRGGLGRGG